MIAPAWAVWPRERAQGPGCSTGYSTQMLLPLRTSRSNAHLTVTPSTAAGPWPFQLHSGCCTCLLGPGIGRQRKTPVSILPKDNASTHSKAKFRTGSSGMEYLKMGLSVKTHHVWAPYSGNPTEYCAIQGLTQCLEHSGHSTNTFEWIKK